MIKPEKYNHALYALHQIFVGARFMAFTEVPHEKIARLLDYAEIMPEYIASENDETEKFHKSLEGIAETFPNLKYILDNFNSDSVHYK